MNANRERIAKLQQEMKAEGMDMYLVPTADFHQSEYVGDYFKARAWLSGFTGSAGTLVVTQDQACLWTDWGRKEFPQWMRLSGKICPRMAVLAAMEGPSALPKERSMRNFLTAKRQ